MQAWICKYYVVFRLNMALFGVKVLLIEPGFFKTNMSDVAGLNKNTKMLWDKMPQEVRDDYGTDYLQNSKFGSSFYKFVCFLFK